MTLAANFELADDDSGTGATDGVMELLQQRDAIQGWLDRLDAQRGTANAKVIDRVRADYESRLSSTLEALASHRAEIAGELTSAQERLATAGRERTEAGERLEEGELRHRIGELSEDDWTSERAVLEVEAERAQQAEIESAADVSRLRDLLEQLDERNTSADEDESAIVDLPVLEERPTAATADGQTADEDFIEEENVLEDTVAEETVAEETAVELADVTIDFPPPPAQRSTEAFLAEIDRALDDDVTLSAEEGEEPGPDTSPKPGLKCPECGYTNDISAWFCGVCGADIG